MDSYSDLSSNYVERLAFIETLSREFFATTGYGIYAYFHAVDIERLFEDYRSLGVPVRLFVRRCVRNHSL